MQKMENMANLELNIEFVVRVESFTLEQGNELCTRIWVLLVGLRHSLHMHRTLELSPKSFYCIYSENFRQ